MSAAQLILEALDEVSSDDMRRFHFFLNVKMVEGCKPISKQRLEGQPREGIVSLMIDQYGDDLAVTVTDVILEKIDLNSIRRRLTSAYAEGQAGRSSGSSAPSSSSSSSSAPSPAPVTMSAQQGATIIAPTLTGGTVGTLNITFNKP